MHPLKLGGSWQDMFLLGIVAEGGAGSLMAPLGSALALVPKFNGSNIILAE